MKIQVLSDVHLEFGVKGPHIDPIADCLALVGDIGKPSNASYQQFLLEMSSLFEHVYVIAGNHEYYTGEYYTTRKQIETICRKRENLHFLDPGTLLYENRNDPSNKVRVIGATLWSHVPPQNEKAVANGLNDYVYVKVAENDQHRLLTVQDTNKWHAEQLMYIQNELQKAKNAGEKVLLLTHHA
jgi:3',5'-cyclic AMP phosphodiesterase CpdA